MSAGLSSHVTKLEEEEEEEAGIYVTIAFLKKGNMNTNCLKIDRNLVENVQFFV